MYIVYDKIQTTFLLYKTSKCSKHRFFQRKFLACVLTQLQCFLKCYKNSAKAQFNQKFSKNTAIGYLSSGKFDLYN